MNSLVSEILNNYEKPETIETLVGKEFLNAYNTQQDKIKKSIEDAFNDEELELRKLATHYRELETKGKLLYVQYFNWNKIPYKVQEKINNEYNPLHYSGTCLDMQEVEPNLDDIFSVLKGKTLSSSVVKFPTHYQLIMYENNNCYMTKTKMSIKEVDEFTQYALDNIVWISK